MSKIIVIKEDDLLKIKEAIEDDVYTIGAETDSPMGGSYYHVNDSSSEIQENIETEVEPSDISLSSFKKQKELPTRIWKDDDTLDSRIRLKLLDIADDFWNSVNITWVEPQGIILTGSICNFNWSKYSDIDLHLIVDFDEVDEKTEFVKQYMDSKKNEWNEQHKNLKIMGFDVELYVQNIGEMPQSSGIYDLEENEWIEKPSGDDIKPIQLNKFPIKDKAAEIMTIIDDMYDELNSTDDKHIAETIGEDASHLWKLVKCMRTNSLEKDGESGSGNIVYKVLRRSGYLDKLFGLFSITYDKVNSIDEPTSDIRENIFNKENIKSYITEEVVADGNSEHNPYAKRWKAERQALKDFLTNYGKIMTSKENGKEYKVYYDKTLSELIGINYCICIQWDRVNMKPKSTIYVRALDKFTDRIFQARNDLRGRDNQYGTNDDLQYQQYNY